MSRFAGLLLALALLLSPAVSLAANPSEMLSDPKLETRAEAVGNGLRCLVFGATSSCAPRSPPNAAAVRGLRC